ncbi:Na+/H+ antiporter NhaC family protein [uncultured Dysosmobacter sp.]|uniref:Na+/H+ antiporter NhaC family protein n=1 Tax=uncultured Dysosmobacter sp. TaxID=2591384 RepID=UPI002632DFBC|nr:Na+/H+ antiporter NhaC family protein [uncultured Dysosmobacter sp.]
MSKRGISKAVDAFSGHCANPGIMLMCLIFVLAGMFSGVTKGMGAVDSTVNLALSFIPARFITAGLFLICVFISTSMGTCLGTISAIAPIALGFIEAAGLDPAITMSAVIGGSMFGDNLSVISDTTIAATRGAGCEMKDKFRMNFKIALPAAIVTTIIYCIIGGGAELGGTYEFELIKVIPYLVVLVCAISGMNVIYVLLTGTVLSAIIGMATGSMGLVSLSASATSGVSGMLSLVLMALFMKGLSGMAADMGGMEWLTGLFTNIKSRRGAQYAIAAIVSVIDFFIGNNTIAIIISTPLCKPIAKKFKVAPERLASLMDIFGVIVPGFSPLSSAFLVVTTMSTVTPLQLMTRGYYLFFLFVFTVITIQFNLLQTKEEKEGREFYPELDEAIAE